MVRTMIIITATSLLIGCASGPAKIRTDVVEQLVPVLHCPPPPDGVLQRPQLPIATITEESSPGDVAKKYKATVKSLQGYAQRLEQVVKNYDEISKKTADVQQQFATTVQQEQQMVRGGPIPPEDIIPANERQLEKACKDHWWKKYGKDISTDK